MAHKAREPETPTIEALLTAFARGGVTRREFLRRAGLLGVTAAGAGALADAAAPARAAAQTTQKRELVVAQGGDISKFDPHFSTSANDIRISFNIFDNLTSRHPDQKLYPALATEWKAAGPQTWTFKLRSGVKWHNGDPFTSEDAKFSLERTYDPAAKTMVATVFTTIERIEAPDPLTLVIHTKKPDPLIPARLAFYGGQMVPKKYLTQVGPDTFNAKPIGTGPVRLGSWTKDDKTILEANPDYWGGRIEVDRVVALWFTRSKWSGGSSTIASISPLRSDATRAAFSGIGRNTTRSTSIRPPQ
jgi:peptide/nickel transport system substrate-binding protein